MRIIKISEYFKKENFLPAELKCKFCESEFADIHANDYTHECIGLTQYGKYRHDITLRCPICNKYLYTNSYFEDKE